MNKLEEENRMLKRTLSYVSHELLNVLTLIIYAEGEIEKVIDKIAENENWSYIVNDTAYMVKILKNLSGLNHAGEVRTESCDIYTYVKDVVSEMSRAYSGIANISMVDKMTECENNSKKDIYDVEIDKNKMKQVLVNLIKNGVESIGERKDGKIDVCVEREKKWITVMIKDNGCGIDAKNVERVFEEGFTLNKKDGSGLGLPISKKIVESHGGEISLNSTMGLGTVFYIKLPVEANQNQKSGQAYEEF